MIPTIEQIIDDLMAGVITKSQAVTWLLQHSETAHADLRDHFAGLAMQGMMVDVNDRIKKEALTTDIRYLSDAINNIRNNSARSAYAIADAMLAARNV